MKNVLKASKEGLDLYWFVRIFISCTAERIYRDLVNEAIDEYNKDGYSAWENYLDNLERLGNRKSWMIYIDRLDGIGYKLLKQKGIALYNALKET